MIFYEDSTNVIFEITPKRVHLRPYIQNQDELSIRT